MKQNKKPEEFPEQIEYREAHKDLKDAELMIALRSRGIDPYEISQKDFDDIRRLINRMQQVDASTKSGMNAIQQEGTKEQSAISQEIEVIVARVGQEQHPMPPLPELHIEPEQTGQQETEKADTGVQEG